MGERKGSMTSGSSIGAITDRTARTSENGTGAGGRRGSVGFKDNHKGGDEWASFRDSFAIGEVADEYDSDADKEKEKDRDISSSRARSVLGRREHTSAGKSTAGTKFPTIPSSAGATEGFLSQSNSVSATARRTASPRSKQRRGSLDASSTSPMQLSPFPGQQVQQINTEIKFRFVPLNPVYSACFAIHGPPLDILKKSGNRDAKGAGGDGRGESSSKQVESVYGRTRIWWLCLINLRTYFYESFGHGKPKLISDIVDANVRYIRSSREAQNAHKVNIRHADGRLWTLDFATEYEALKFEYAVEHSQLAYKGEGQPVQYMKTSDLHIARRKDFGFSSNITY
jgi:hypothetical protein